MDEDRGLKTLGKQFAGDDHTAEVGDDEGRGQGDGDPDDGDGRGLLDLRRLADGHEADQDVRHAEITETPGETGDDVLPGRREDVRDEGVNGAVIEVGVNGVDRRRVEVFDEDRDDRDRQQGDEHEGALEEVGPADRLEAAEERVEKDDGREDDHGSLSREAGDQGHEDRGAGDETGGDIDGEADEEHDGRNDGQNGLFREETVLQVFRQGDGVVRGLRELTKTFGDEDPVEGGTDGKTDADPGFAEAEGQDRAGKTHEEPGGHVGSLCTEGSDPGAHLAAAEEVLLFTVTVFSGTEEEKQTDTEDDDKVEHEGEDFKIHGFLSLFSNRIDTLQHFTTSK